MEEEDVLDTVGVIASESGAKNGQGPGICSAFKQHHGCFVGDSIAGSDPFVAQALTATLQINSDGNVISGIQHYRKCYQWCLQEVSAYNATRQSGPALNVGDAWCCGLKQDNYCSWRLGSSYVYDPLWPITTLWAVDSYMGAPNYECAVCHHDASCYESSSESPTCTCKPGYVGDGMDCMGAWFAAALNRPSYPIRN